MRCWLGATAMLTAAAAAETTRFDSSATLVPPVAVSERVEVELRVAVRNLSTAEADFKVSFHVEDVASFAVTSRNVKIPAHGQRLVSFRVPTKELAGDHQAVAEVSTVGSPPQSHQWPLRVEPSETRSVPRLQVGWIEPGAFTVDGYPHAALPDEAYVRSAVDAYARLGFRALIVAYPESIYGGAGVYYPSKLFDGYEKRCDFDIVGAILDQASKNGQHVFLGLGRGSDLNLTWTGFDDAQRNREAFAHSAKVATELWTLYHDQPSFYGWYLTHEANAIARASESYYNPVTRFLRTFEADKPVLISPSGTPEVSPEALEKCEADIIVYQDAVGAGYVPYEYTYQPQRRIEGLEVAFSTYAAAHRGARQHLWSNLELWQMDGPEYRNAYPAVFERVRRQMEIERNHVDVLTAYALPGFVEPTDSPVRLGGDRAVRLFEGYRDYLLDRDGAATRR